MMSVIIDLIEPTEALRDAYIDFAEDFCAAGEMGYQAEREEAQKDFAGLIRRLRDYAKGIGLPEGYVPATS